MLLTHFSILQVLRPCSVTLEAKSHPNQPLSGSVMVEEVIVKVFISSVFW